MRTTQWIGLSPQGILFAKEHTDLGHFTGRSTSGMFDEPIALADFVDQRGNVLLEVVQAKPWSSGPMIFTCLEATFTDEHGTFGPYRFGEWTEEEINQY